MTYKVAALITALSDPTRRAVFERLGRSPAAVGEIAAGMTVSRPAVSQHLKVLREAGLVTERAAGTRRIYSIDPRGIGALRDWLDGFWGDRLDDFARYVDEQEGGR